MGVIGSCAVGCRWATRARRRTKLRPAVGGAGLAVRLLGPLAVEVDGGPVRLGSVKQKAILAQLALRGGQVAQVAELVAGLWGEDPPVTATNAIQVHVSMLRRALGRAGNLIQTQPPGYRLAGAGVDVDVLRFEQLVEQARQGRPDKWRAALAEWTGETALADLAEVPFAPAVATRLDELRLTATEELIEHELALGHHTRWCLSWPSSPASTPTGRRSRAS